MSIFGTAITGYTPVPATRVVCNQTFSQTSPFSPDLTFNSRKFSNKLHLKEVETKGKYRRANLLPAVFCNLHQCTSLPQQEARLGCFLWHLKKPETHLKENFCCHSAKIWRDHYRLSSYGSIQWQKYPGNICRTKLHQEWRVLNDSRGSGSNSQTPYFSISQW